MTTTATPIIGGRLDGKETSTDFGPVILDADPPNDMAYFLTDGAYRYMRRVDIPDEYHYSRIDGSRW